MRRRHPKRWIPREVRTRRRLHGGRDSDELEALTWPESAIRVKDCMTHPAVTVQSSALVRGATEMMRTRRIRHLPVVDRDGRLVGIVTDRDLRQVIFDPAIADRLGQGVQALNALAVRDIMTWGVVTVRPETEIREAARLMHEQKVGALPVVQGDRVVGILTESDVLEVFATVLGHGVLAKPYRWAFAYR
jgi:acetoin utilization protein AcuB